MRAELVVVCAAVFASSGCTTDQANVEKGLHNTIAYSIRVESSEPVRVEVNHQPAGITPLTLKVFGDRDGTFHNFGSDEFVVRAYPSKPDDFPQTRIFKTGAFGIKDDRIPERIYFDFSKTLPVVK